MAADNEPVAFGRRVRFHDLRHFVGTELHARGVPMAAISRRLGHRHPSTTSDIYARHSTVEADRQASQVIGELLGAQKPPRPPAAEPGDAADGEANYVGDDLADGAT